MWLTMAPNWYDQNYGIPQRRLNIRIKVILNDKSIGFCYWAPDWVALDDNAATSTNGSAWNNQCMFDFEHKALPVFDVYRAE